MLCSQAPSPVPSLSHILVREGDPPPQPLYLSARRGSQSRRQVEGARSTSAMTLLLSPLLWFPLPDCLTDEHLFLSHDTHVEAGLYQCVLVTHRNSLVSSGRRQRAAWAHPHPLPGQRIYRPDTDHAARAAPPRVHAHVHVYFRSCANYKAFCLKMTLCKSS